MIKRFLIKIACLEDKVKLLEEKLKEKTNELNSKGFTYDDRFGICNDMNGYFFEKCKEMFTGQTENNYEYMGGMFESKFSSHVLEFLNIKPDPNFGFS